MIDMKRTTPRRAFLGTLAAGAAGLGIAGLASPMVLGNESQPAPPSADHAAFDAWLKKIKGKHRQVFDATSPHEGFPLIWARVFLMTNKQVGVADNDVTAVIVLRHDAIPLAMDDKLWEKYKFGEIFKVTDKGTNAPALRNIYQDPKPDEFLLPDIGVSHLTKSGVLLGVCDMALTVYSSHVAADMKMDPAECKKEWVAGILPGVAIVPSGVLAVNRAQEKGCTYCFAG